MSSKKFHGIVTADIVEVRFAYSGRLSRVNKKPGDIVKKGEILASLDRRELQANLDKELADYERARAEFEMFNIHNPGVGSDLVKFEKVQKQAALNSSVKSVEIAKFRLDDVDLKSPVNGIVIDNGTLRPGLFVTPGSYPYQILDTDSYYLEVEIEHSDFEKFMSGSTHKIKLDGIKDPIIATVLPLIPPTQKSQLLLRFSIPPTPSYPSIFPNLSGHLED